MGDNEYKRLHREMGLCQNCSNKAKYPNRLCENHIVTRMNTNIKTRKVYKEGGRCTRCSATLDNEVDNGFLTCINCRHQTFYAITFR
jgi:DNA-directed RNA polymerase subunit RPC12/RpoP